MPTRDCIDDQLARFVALGYPGAPPAEMIDLTAEEWSEVLDDLPDADFVAACRLYKRSTEASDRFFPLPARIRAMSPSGRAAAHLGSDADADQAFADFVQRMPAVCFRPNRDDATGAAHLDPADPYRNDAMFAGLAAVGGAQAWGRAEIGNPATLGSLRKVWAAAYRDVRKGQARDPEALRLTASTQRLLSVNP